VRNKFWKSRIIILIAFHNAENKDIEGKNLPLMCGCEKEYFTLREQWKKGQVVLHNEDLHNLCMLPHIVRVCEI
jgi:hypothetical protein